MSMFWKILLIAAFVLSLPTAVWVVREISARSKAKAEAEKLAGTK